MEYLILALFLLTLLAALLLWRAARQLRAQSGLPAGTRIVYSDTGAWRKVEKPLFSRRHLLTGKPDYLLEAEGRVIPVEVKPGRTASEPQAWDIMQLAAYGLLVEEAYGSSPPYGLLKYRDQVFQIDLTTELRAELLQAMEEMQRDREAREVPRSHEQVWRCRSCGFREACGQALEDE